MDSRCAPACRRANAQSCASHLQARSRRPRAHSLRRRSAHSSADTMEAACFHAASKALSRIENLVDWLGDRQQPLGLGELAVYPDLIADARNQHDFFVLGRCQVANLIWG